MLAEAPVRDRRVIGRWALENDPRGLAVGDDGTVYVGLAKTQSVIAIDPATGRVVDELVLDREEIASTKELVTIRSAGKRNRLVIANGSDESVTIVGIPKLHVLREIGLEGEVIRDAVPDPTGRHLYVLGRTVHVYDFDGKMEIAELAEITPTAIAVSSDGSLLAVVGTEVFNGVDASVVSLYDTQTLKEISREPLQTDRRIQSVLFAAGDRSLVVLAADWFGEKSLAARSEKQMANDNGRQRVRFDFGDFISGEQICLPQKSGPQVAASGLTSRSVIFAERRCSSSATFTASERKVTTASLYALSAYAITVDRTRKVVYATDPGGFLVKLKIPPDK